MSKERRVGRQKRRNKAYTERSHRSRELERRFDSFTNPAPSRERIEHANGNHLGSEPIPMEPEREHDVN